MCQLYFWVPYTTFRMTWDQLLPHRLYIAKEAHSMIMALAMEAAPAASELCCMPHPHGQLGTCWAVCKDTIKEEILFFYLLLGGAISLRHLACEAKLGACSKHNS